MRDEEFIRRMLVPIDTPSLTASGTPGGCNPPRTRHWGRCSLSHEVEHQLTQLGEGVARETRRERSARLSTVCTLVTASVPSASRSRTMHSRRVMCRVFSLDAR